MSECSYVVRGFPFRHRAWPYKLAWQTAWSGADPLPGPCQHAAENTDPGAPLLNSRRRVRCWYGDHTNGCDTDAETFKPATQIGWFQRNNYDNGLLQPCPFPRTLEPGIQTWHRDTISIECEYLAEEGGNCVNKGQNVLVKRHGLRISRKRATVNADGTYGRPGNLRVYMVGTTVSDPLCCCKTAAGQIIGIIPSAQCANQGGVCHPVVECSV